MLNNKTMRERPSIVMGATEKFKTGCCSLYISINQDYEKNLFEIFLNLGKGGGCVAQSEAIARLVSLCFRCGVNPLEIIQQLRGIRCSAVYSARIRGKTVDALSCPDAVARAISKSIDDKQESTSEGKFLNELPDRDRSTEGEEGQLQIWQSYRGK